MGRPFAFSWLNLLKFDWKSSPGNAFGALIMIEISVKGGLIFMRWSCYKLKCIYVYPYQSRI